MNNLLQKCIDAMLLEKNRERERIIDKCVRDYSNKTCSEGLSDYERRMEAFDELFDERKEELERERREKSDE